MMEALADDRVMLTSGQNWPLGKHALAQSERISHQQEFRRRQRTREELGRTIVATRIAMVFAIGIVYLIFFTHIGRTLSNDHHQPVFPTQKESPFIDGIWDKITPTEELIWHKCRSHVNASEPYTCARLLVPMNYNRTDGKGSRFALALLRKPAKVSIADPRYGGPVLTNPGGPGGSGVDMLQAAGFYLSDVLDSTARASSGHISELSGVTQDDRYFDIITWDPRGIGRTTPTLSCFPDSFARSNWRLESAAVGILGSSAGAFIHNWMRSKALGDGCSQRLLQKNAEGEAIAEFVNTTPVVNDMLTIIERHDEWVQQQRAPTPVAKASVGKSNEPVKLQYWGFSYGTIIGQTFATMYPDRISRMVLDGVVDAQDYYNGPWFSALADTDKIFDQLLEYCYHAGPLSCPIYLSDGPVAMKERYRALEEQTLRNPIPVPAYTTPDGRAVSPEIITWTDLKDFFRLAIYQPSTYFPIYASFLPELAAGNGTQLAAYKQSGRRPTCPSTNEECRKAGLYSGACNIEGVGRDASTAILCTDAPGLNVGIEELEEFWIKQRNQSWTLGDWWTHERLQCTGWRAKAKWRVHNTIAGNTSHPILFVGNTYDPVTPLRNCHKMSKSFPDSVVLQQDSEGHCSLSSRSLCTIKHIHEYFQTGKLPEKGTVCEPVERPFLGGIEDMGIAAGDRDQILRKALTGLVNVYGEHSGWYPTQPW